MEIRDQNLGRITVETIPLPDDILSPGHPIYTASGSILFLEQRRPDDPDHYRLSVMDDDGLNIRVIFNGKIQQPATANGTPRLMPFMDNWRILLGDFVLECEPDIDRCQKARLVPLEYPDLLIKDPGIIRHWSEIVISPDNRHIAWTMLHIHGAFNFYGQLERETNRYRLSGVQQISTSTNLSTDPQRPGELQLPPVIGGEIKQFIHGGAALSLAGSVGNPLPDSVEQSLLEQVVLPVTNCPGYEETTIFSPDETLGIVMSTRGSPKTSFSILGLMPRPLGHLATNNLAMPVYMVAVAGVRSFLPGNIGPVLVEIDKSRYDPTYPGVQLNEPGSDWVYLSPISWHPDGTKAIWPETIRGGGKTRIRQARLWDVKPNGQTPELQAPAVVPYGIPLEAVELASGPTDISGNISGKAAGHARYTRSGSSGLGQTTYAVQVDYIGYSDDAKTFFDGIEQVTAKPGEICYQAKLRMSGSASGEMDLRLTFETHGFDGPVNLLFDCAADGKPKSYGTAQVLDRRLNVEDMKP